MLLTGAQKEHLARLRGGAECAGGLQCIESELEVLCQVHNLGHGGEAFLECRAAVLCPGRHTMIFGNSMRICGCPVRQYLWKEFGK